MNRTRISRSWEAIDMAQGPRRKPNGRFACVDTYCAASFRSFTTASLLGHFRQRCLGRPASRMVLLMTAMYPRLRDTPTATYLGHQGAPGTLHRCLPGTFRYTCRRPRHPPSAQSCRTQQSASRNCSTAFDSSGFQTMNRPGATHGLNCRDACRSQPIACHGRAQAPRSADADPARRASFAGAH